MDWACDSHFESLAGGDGRTSPVDPTGPTSLKEAWPPASQQGGHPGVLLLTTRIPPNARMFLTRSMKVLATTAMSCG